MLEFMYPCADFWHPTHSGQSPRGVRAGRVHGEPTAERRQTVIVGRHLACFPPAGVFAMGDSEERGRLEQIRAAKRALRKFQQRREQERGKRASRTLRASVVLQGGATPTLLTQSFKASNTATSSARESAQRATDASRRRHSRTQSMLSDTSAADGRRSSVRLSQAMPPPSAGAGGKRRSVHVRNPSVSLGAQLPPPAGRRPMSMIFSHQPTSSLQGSSASAQRDSVPRMSMADAPKRRSRHSRQLSISTRRESFEVMSGRNLGAGTRTSQRASHAGRASVRFSALEAASVLFHAGMAQKPLPPVPQEWRAGLWDGDTDEGQDRESALEKLEGRGAARDTTPPAARRARPPSWLQPKPEAPHSSPPALGSPWDAAPPSAPAAPVEESLDTLVEEDEDESGSRTHAQAAARTEPRGTPADAVEALVAEAKRRQQGAADTAAEADTSTESSRALRPLRLSSLNASGTPLLGTTRRASAAMPKAVRRASNIYYKPAQAAQAQAAQATPADAAAPRGHHAPSTRSAQSSNTSWPLTDAAGSALFSPRSAASDSPGATSIESGDHTPKRAPRPAPPAPEPVLARVQSELHAERERHLHEITELQREVEEVRHVMGAQLAGVAGARDAAEARVAALEADTAQLRERLEEAEGVRDMYADDVEGWRRRCNDLEQTIRTQQLRFKQEQSWRNAAMKRMQALSNRLKTHEGSFDSTSSSQLGPLSSVSSVSSTSLADGTWDGAPELPTLPEMPSEEELGDWSTHVARQLSKQAPEAAAPPQDLAPETVHLLADMRQQIMGLYAELKLEQSNHELTRTQLREAQQAHAVQPNALAGVASPVTTFTPADVSQAPSAASSAAPSVSTPRPRASSASRRRRQAFLRDDGTSGSQSTTRSYTSSIDPAETTADVLFASHGKNPSLVGLGLGPPPRRTAAAERWDSVDATPRPDTVHATRDEPAWPETSQDTSWLDEDSPWAGQEEAAQPHETPRPSTVQADAAAAAAASTPEPTPAAPAAPAETAPTRLVSAPLPPRTAPEPGKRASSAAGPRAPSVSASHAVRTSIDALFGPASVDMPLLFGADEEPAKAEPAAPAQLAEPWSAPSEAAQAWSAPTESAEPWSASNEATESWPASNEAAEPWPAPTEATEPWPAPTESTTESWPAPTEAAESWPAPTESAEPWSAPNEATEPWPAPTEAAEPAEPWSTGAEPWSASEDDWLKPAESAAPAAPDAPPPATTGWPDDAAHDPSTTSSTADAPASNSYDGTAIEIPADLTQTAMQKSPDLETGGETGDESAWVDEEDSPTTPTFPRPEFIPEWSFEQAMFEAAQDVRVYELSGRKPCSKQSRRGAARVRPPPVEDFFGILNAAELKPALPLPSYALDMPPVDLVKLQAAPPVRTSVLRAQPARGVARTAQAMLGRSAYVDEAAPAPFKAATAPATSVAIPFSDSVYDPYEPPLVEEERVTEQSPFMTQMFASVKSPWLANEKPIAADDCEAQLTSSPEIPITSPYTSPPSDAFASASPWPTTPRTSTMDRLAPSIPPPSTPVPRSPDVRLASPNSAGQRFIRRDTQTRIPVPTPVWRLNFSQTTATPEARPCFTI